MSLADEYESHLPPQGHLAREGGQSGTLSETTTGPRLEVVEEGPRGARHRQRHSLALAGTSSSQPPHSLSTPPIATTSNVTSRHLRSASRVPASTPQLSASYSEQVMAWLRGSTSRMDHLHNRDGSAADALRGILGDKHTATPS